MTFVAVPPTELPWVRFRLIAGYSCLPFQPGEPVAMQKVAFQYCFAWKAKAACLAAVERFE